MNVEFYPEADAEFESAAAFYEAERTGLGDEFRDAFDEVCDRILQNPEGWPRYGRTPVRHCLFHRFPYCVFYAVRLGRVWIVAIAHHRRRPGYWLKRLRSG